MLIKTWTDLLLHWIFNTPSLNQFTFFLFFLFNFTIFYWCCHISKWICHRYTCVPHPKPSSPYHPSGSSQCTFNSRFYSKIQGEENDNNLITRKAKATNNIFKISLPYILPFSSFPRHLLSIVNASNLDLLIPYCTL